jgi:acyl-CoA synthetase (NDP forming)
MHEVHCASLFSPSSIAIVGASPRNPYAMSALQRLADCKYPGAIYPIHSSGGELLGHRVYRSIEDVGCAIEMALIAVARHAVPEVLESCARQGAKAAVIVSNGFAESDDTEGAVLQERVRHFLQSNTMAVCGPSCLGVINVPGRFQAFGGKPGVAIDPGGISLVSQSGANVHTFLGAARARNLGFSQIVSSGNEVGLELTDYLQWFLDDPHTRVICAYVESIRSVARFIELATRAAQLQRPIILLKIGRSETSERAALAHTGAMTGPDRLFDTLFKQLGIQRADSIEEALDRAAIFAGSDQRWWPRGGRCGLLSVSGGFAAALADLSSPTTFLLPEFEAPVAARLRSILPSNVASQNPIDISTQVHRDRPSAWGEAVQAVAGDSGIDLVLSAEATPFSLERAELLSSIRDSTGIPIILASTSPHIEPFAPAVRDYCRAIGLPILAGVEGTRSALQAATTYRNDRVRVLAGLSEANRSSWKDGFSTLEPHIRRPSSQTVDEVNARALLSPFGFRSPRAVQVWSRSKAGQAATALGGPVAVKAISSRLPHRTELGLVRLSLEGAEAAENAFESVANGMRESGVELGKDPDASILIQSMVTGVAELLIGAVGTAGYPPMIVVSLGGVTAELLSDVSSRIAPVGEVEARAMLKELKLYPLLEGYRRQPAADVDSIVEAILGMSRFACMAQDWLAEAEINPLIVGRPGQGAWAVDALVTVRPIASPSPIVTF